MQDDWEWVQPPHSLWGGGLSELNLSRSSKTWLSALMWVRSGLLLKKGHLLFALGRVPRRARVSATDATPVERRVPEY